MTGESLRQTDTNFESEENTMKKILALLLAVAMIAAFCACAQQSADTAPAASTDTAAETTTDTAAETPAAETTTDTAAETPAASDGALIKVGRTFYLHKKPIAGLIRFGLDATWFDLNYTNYKLEYRWEDNYDEEEEPETSNFHQAEIGMQVGPSVTVNPVGKLNVNAYFRFAPSFSALYDDDTLLGNYASYFVTGGGISYGVIGLGVESRWGSCKFKSFGSGDSEEDEQEPAPGKSKFNGMRVYLSFRF